MRKIKQISYGFHSTPFGLILVGILDEKVCHLAFVDSKKKALQEFRAKWEGAEFTLNQKPTQKIMEQLFPKNKKPKKKIQIQTQGTDFQMKVWKTLLQIPSGTLASYKDIAKMIGSPTASRAVGTAIAANSVAILIPCHRVVKTNGAIGGYRWGTSRKQALIDFERL